MRISLSPVFIMETDCRRNATDAGIVHVAAITAPLTHTPDLVHRYLVSGGTFSFHRVISALIKHYPVLEGVLPKADPTKYDEVLPPFSTKKAKRELGARLDKGWEQSIVVELFGSAASAGRDWSEFGATSMLKKD